MNGGAPLDRHRITIEATTLGERGHRYRATYAGSILIEGNRVPALDACRALLALGITGKLEVWRPGKVWADMQLEIEGGAKLTVEESDRQTPRFVRWRPREDASANAPQGSEGSARTRGSEISAPSPCLRLSCTLAPLLAPAVQRRGVASA